MNYEALGQYHAFTAQARDEAGRRYALLSNAAVRLQRGALNPDDDQALLDSVRADLDEAETAMRAMNAALHAANHVADLAGQRRLTAADVRPFKD